MEGLRHLDLGLLGLLDLCWCYLTSPCVPILTSHLAQEGVDVGDLVAEPDGRVVTLGPRPPGSGPVLVQPLLAPSSLGDCQLAASLQAVRWLPAT